jgi:hypothetical protein
MALDPLLGPHFDPLAKYKQSSRVPINYWSPGEDELLSLGLRRHGTNFGLIQSVFFPHKVGK